MSKRRATWVAVVWLVTVLVVTGWVMAQADGEVTIGNAVLVGAVVGTLLSAGVATLRRK